MQITQLLGSNTLLTYALVTSPSPVQVSPQSGPPSVATLTIVVSCPINLSQVTVTELTFNLPIGDPSDPDATDLSETTIGIPSVSSSGGDNWEPGPGAAPGTYIVKPQSGNDGVIAGQGLTITFTGIQVSPIVGTAVVSIVETATSDSSPAQPRQCSIAVPKFPYGFFVDNFATTTPLVQNGQPATLSWVGSVGAIYTMLWGENPPEDVSNVNQWTTPQGLTDTTTFILEVTAQESGQTVKHYSSLTVIVADPNVTVNTLTVLTTSSLQGAVAIGGALNVAETLSVTGAITGFGTVPVGSVTPYAGDAIANASPLQAQGWLACDGSAISRTTFATLFAVIGTLHGVGDGSTTFNLPDYRGRFLRGTDHGAGRDPDIGLRVAANPGGATGDSTGSIQPWASGKPVNTAFTTDTQGAHNHTISNVPTGNSSYKIAGSYLARWTDASATTSTDGAHQHTIVGGGDNESRPINAYVDYLIRFQ